MSYRMKRQMVSVALAALTVAFTASCRQDNGYLYETSPVKHSVVPSDRPGFGLTEDLYNSLRWYWACPDEPSNPPASDPANPVIVGPGPHDLIAARFHNVPLTFMGKMCPARRYSRDVVFAIDISTTMAWADPLNSAGDSCRRIEILDRMIDALPADAQFGVVAFEEDPSGDMPNSNIFVSSRLFSDKNAMYADLINGSGTLADKLCMAAGRKDIKFALENAEALLETGRADGNKKEVFLLTDGDVDSLMHSAVPTADRLKTVGVNVSGEQINVSIAGVQMIDPVDGNVDEVLGTLVSQAPGGGQFLAEDPAADALFSQVGNLATNDIESARIRYRKKGGGSWNSLNVDVTNTIFQNAPETIDLRRNDIGYDFEFKYGDSHGNEKSFSGEINWIR